MTELLEKAFTEASRLPQMAQDAIAALLLKEVASEQRWTQTFAQSQDALAKLADEALAEFQNGKTKLIEEDSDFSHD